MLDPLMIQVISVIAIVVALLALLIFIARRIRRVPPNEALVIVGRGAGRASPESAVGQVLGEGTEVVKSLTGLDVHSILAGLAGGKLVQSELAKD